MDETTKRKKIQKYFKTFPAWTIVLVVLGIIAILIGTAYDDSVVSILVGITLITGGGMGILVSQSGKPSDDQIDDWLEADRQDLLTRSKTKLGLDESQVITDPYEVFVWVWRREGTCPDAHGIPSEDIRHRRGKTNCKYEHFYYSRVRHSAWRLQVFYPTEHYLASYGCSFDFLRGTFLNERTGEIYYRDITIVETSTYDRIDIKDKGLKKSEFEAFRLKVSSGDSVEVTIPSAYLINQTLRDSLSEVPSTECEKMVQSMRKMIQSKKT